MKTILTLFALGFLGMGTAAMADCHWLNLNGELVWTCDPPPGNACTQAWDPATNTWYTVCS